MKAVKKHKLVLLMVLATVAVLGVAVFLALPKPVAVSQPYPTLATVPDGSYTGSCDNGLVAATVQVTVAGHAITEIQILEHRTGTGKPAEVITGQVVAAQNLAVDKVAGATMSSATILKAIENALQTA